MADKELELWGEIGAPAWVATAKLGVRWKRTWANRRSEYADQVVAESGLERDQVIKALERDERRSDLFTAGLGRVGEIEDPEYRSALSRLVGAAFHDAAAIEEIDYLTAQVVKLEPLHLRILRQTLRHHEGGAIAIHRGDGLPRTRGLQLATVARDLDVSRGLALAALESLVAGGFLTPDPTESARERRDADRAVDKGFSAPTRYPKFNTTHWTRQALALCLALDPPSSADEP